MFFSSLPARNIDLESVAQKKEVNLFALWPSLMCLVKHCDYIPDYVWVSFWMTVADSIEDSPINASHFKCDFLKYRCCEKKLRNVSVPLYVYVILPLRTRSVSLFLENGKSREQGLFH